MRSNLLPLKNVQSVLSMQWLVCRSLQLDSSSREEMYYPSRSNPMKHRTSSASAVSTRTARCRRPLLDPASEEDVALIDLGTTTVVVALMM